MKKQTETHRLDGGACTCQSVRNQGVLFRAGRGLPFRWRGAMRCVGHKKKTHTPMHTHTEMCIQPSYFQVKQPTHRAPMMAAHWPKWAPVDCRSKEFWFWVLRRRQPHTPFSGGEVLRPFCLWPWFDVGIRLRSVSVSVSESEYLSPLWIAQLTPAFWPRLWPTPIENIFI